MLKYKQKLQLPDKARLWPSQDKTDPPSSNMLRNGFTQELLTASGPQTSDRGLDAVDHCCQNYSGLNQDAAHVENITVAPAKPWLCAVLIQAPSHPSRTSA